MLTEIFSSLALALRRVLAGWRALLLQAAVYAALLATIYFFVAVREASVAQVTLTFALALLAPLLFFVLQTMIANGVYASAEARPLALAGSSLKSFWKFILITLPLIALAVLIVYLLAKYQGHLASGADATSQFRPVQSGRAQQTARAVINWKAALISTVRYLALGLVLPLMAIQLWLATAREGLAAAGKSIGHLVARAFAPRAILIYMAGFLLFAVIPYFILFRTTQTKYAWLELFLLGLRLFAVFALTLIGWVVTVKAIGLAHEPAHIPAQETA